MNRIRKFFSDLKSPTVQNQGPTQNSSGGEDRDVIQWIREDKKAIQIVLFGGKCSGKATLCKQMKLLQLENAFTEQERVLAASVIRELLRVTIQEVGKLMVAAEVCFSDDDKQTSLEYCSRKLNEPGCCQTKTFYDHVQTLYKDELTTDYITKLTNWRTCDNILYFLDKLKTIAMETYMPTDADLVRCKTSDVRHLKVPVTLSRSDLYFSILVQRDSEHISTVLPQTQAILFTVDLHAFTLDEPKDLLQTMELFQLLLTSQSFLNVHVILLLNKIDRLQEAIANERLFERFMESVDPSHQCSAFLQSWYSWEGPSFDEQRAFLDSYPTKDNEAPLTSDVHQRRASFRKKSSMIQTMMTKKGVQSETIHIAVFIRRLFVDMFTRTRQPRTTERQREAKPLSVYYTCAVDTYTTKKVFEGWRNTLLIDRV